MLTPMLGNADHLRYQAKKTGPGAGKRVLFFRVWHPSLHDQMHLGLLNKEAYVSKSGLVNNEGFQYAGNSHYTSSPVKSFELLTEDKTVSVYRVITETGSHYQALFLN